MIGPKMPGIDGQSPRLADIQRCASIQMYLCCKVYTERNQIFILLRSAALWLSDGAIAIRYWLCGIGIVSMMGWAGLLGLLRVAAGAAGPVRDGALFDSPPWGVAEKEAGRAGEGRLIYHTRSLAPLNIRTKPVCGMPVLLPGRCGTGAVHSYRSIRMCTGGTWVRITIPACLIEWSGNRHELRP